MMLLSQLARTLPAPWHGPEARITGISEDSRQVQPGDLFVAQRGARRDGRAYLAQACANGAVAVCATAPVPGFPTIVVPDPRAAVPVLAAAIYDHPARSLRLVGITGTLGKTSTALLVQSALAASGGRVGVIGSLGVRIRGRVADTGMTTPDAPAIHRALRAMADEAVATVVMEVTSHGLALRRVAGLSFALGVLTNLEPDEHLDFHPTPEHYLRTKARFFELLQDGAPLVFNQDDSQARRLAEKEVAHRPRPVVGVSVEGDGSAAVAVRALRLDAAGSAFGLEVRTPLPLLDGGTIEPCVLPLVLPVFGVHQVANAVLAAATALIAGASPRGITEAMAELAPIRRRMEFVHRAGPVILDDTVGNPRSLRELFRSLPAIPHKGFRIVFGIRGSRGAEINRRLGTTLAQLIREGSSAETPIDLIVTASNDTAGPRDRVQTAEREAFLQSLEQAGIVFHFEPSLSRAMERALRDSKPEDLILLLGAQGMDQAGEMAKELLP